MCETFLLQPCKPRGPETSFLKNEVVEKANIWNLVGSVLCCYCCRSCCCCCGCYCCCCSDAAVSVVVVIVAVVVLVIGYIKQ